MTQTAKTVTNPVDLGVADSVLPPDHGREVAGRVVLDYDARCLRRKRLTTDSGAAFMVDLPQTVSLSGGMALALTDGRAIEVAEAYEPVLHITGDLLRLAWHIGNRHCPCQIGTDHLVIRADPVLEQMVLQLGGSVTRSFAPFCPEGGAYGHGRTFGHSH
ncbi:MAG: urease accessory protein UreE [Paracoccus sp. (in: a-proteobacteria)]|uniref:urease accessory protein UreE n=1 Tax=Paracoccus sp. TaxID=267 RepID=UPI0026DECCA0|nr:urease accessory protein UreE [Paracoccus sp. (in: a-proteobacteria)]MDO5612512.1 urease accessory protein UreE [Paracoccus sp. (in: a-proteobacteria)]